MLIERDLPNSIIRLSDGIRGRCSRTGAERGGQNGDARLDEHGRHREPTGASRPYVAATDEEAPASVFLTRCDANREHDPPNRLKSLMFLMLARNVWIGCAGRGLTTNES